MDSNNSSLALKSLHRFTPFNGENDTNLYAQSDSWRSNPSTMTLSFSRRGGGRGGDQGRHHHHRHSRTLARQKKEEDRSSPEGQKRRLSDDSGAACMEIVCSTPRPEKKRALGDLAVMELMVKQGALTDALHQTEIQKLHMELEMSTYKAGQEADNHKRDLESVKQEAELKIAKMQLAQMADEKEQTRLIIEKELLLSQKTIALFEEKERFYLRSREPEAAPLSDAQPVKQSTPSKPVASPNPAPELPPHNTALSRVTTTDNHINLRVAETGYYSIRDILHTLFHDEFESVPVLANMAHLPILAYYTMELMANSDSPLDSRLAANRVNVSNLLLHVFFIAKAMDEKSGNHTVTLNTDANGPRYAPEILAKWYPRFTAGVGTILSPILTMYAEEAGTGRGKYKKCSFCGQKYIIHASGPTKYSHHLDRCDVLANFSNDERAILYAVLHREQSCAEFAQHDFIRAYHEKSLMRLASASEVADNLFVVRYNGDKVRIRMSILLDMREVSYNEFFSRVALFDTSKLAEKILVGGCMGTLMNCFGLQTESARRDLYVATHAKGGVRIPGFLKSILLTGTGEGFIRSSADGRARHTRDFTLNRKTGFGDDLYFSPPIEMNPMLSLSFADAFPGATPVVTTPDLNTQVTENTRRLDELSLGPSIPSINVTDIDAHPVEQTFGNFYVAEPGPEQFDDYRGEHNSSIYGSIAQYY